jgi:hypothetical protein
MPLPLQTVDWEAMARREVDPPALMKRTKPLKYNKK